MTSQIVERIKAVPNETKLLVLDPEADVYYQERGIAVNSAQSNVTYIKTPAAPRATGESSDEDDDRVQMRHGSRVRKRHKTKIKLSKYHVDIRSCFDGNGAGWETRGNRRKE